MGRFRDRLLSSDRRSTIIDVQGYGKIEMRSLTVNEQYDLMDRCRKPDGELDARLLAVETVIAAAYDPDTGEREFEAADRDYLLDSDSQAFSKLLDAANTAAGLDDVDEMARGLEESPTADTSSG